jgi:excisionase family DNA binding protein
LDKNELGGEKLMAELSTSQGGTRVLTVRELSDYLRVHPSTIYRLLKNGQLPGFKVGSDWRFDVETIDRWRASQSSMSNLEGQSRESML